MANPTPENLKRDVLNVDDVSKDGPIVRKKQKNKVRQGKSADGCSGFTVIWDQVKSKEIECPNTEHDFSFSTGPNWRRINMLTIVEFSTVYPFYHHCSKYKCFVCGLGFFRPEDMKSHVASVHSLEEMKHKVVKPQFSNKVDSYTKVDVSTLACRLCAEEIPNFQSLKTHLKRTHSKRIDPDYNDFIVPFKLSRGPLDCQICGESFKVWRTLVLHMNVHFRNFSCEVCGASFITMRSLRSHLRTHDTGAFPCGLCPKVFTTEMKRSSHRRVTHDNRFNRKCPRCPMLFNNTYTLMKHRQAAHDDAPSRYKCDLCDKEFLSKHMLSVHRRQVHLKERNYQCGECHERFFTAFSLKTHAVKHTGARNFQCEVCKKTYPRRGSLRQHLRIHNDDRRFVCSVCGHAFVQNCSLKSHLKSAHGVS